MIKIESLNIIYENPNPILRSIQSLFPNLCPIGDGNILAAHVLGEAFEAVNLTTNISISRDNGKTFELFSKIYNKSTLSFQVSDSIKLSYLGDNKVMAFGYAFDRKDENLTLGNPATGGLLDSNVILSISSDGGKTWSKPQILNSSFGTHIEASAPVTILKNGSYVTPVTNFPSWDGSLKEKMKGRLFRSDDKGKTWNDNTICMDFVNEEITCYEQRLCQLEKSDAVVVIGWNENVKTGKNLENHFTISYDNGLTFSAPKSTGIKGQATGICAIGQDRVFATHAIRRDTENPGIYGYIVNLCDGKWNIEEEILLWKPSIPLTRLKGVSDVFAYTKFGQPLAVKISENNYLVSFWAAEEGVYRTYCLEVTIK